MARASKLDDTYVVDVDDELALGRAPTKPLAGPLNGRVTLDVAEPDALATFFEMVGRVLRAKGKITIIIE